MNFFVTFGSIFCWLVCPHRVDILCSRTLTLSEPMHTTSIPESAPISVCLLRLLYSTYRSCIGHFWQPHPLSYLWGLYYTAQHNSPTYRWACTSSCNLQRLYLLIVQYFNLYLSLCLFIALLVWCSAGKNYCGHIFRKSCLSQVTPSLPGQARSMCGAVMALLLFDSQH